MPHYRYRCTGEGHEFEEWVSIHEDSMVRTCACGDQAVKVMVVPQISPQATPSRRSPTPPRTPDPSWEKGIATDSRGMPLLDAGGNEISVKKYGEDRHKIEEQRRRLATDPNVLRSTRGT